MVDPTTQQAAPNMPQQAPPLTNPPATMDQVDRARAALGGVGATRAQARHREAQQAASGEWQPNIRRTTGPVRSSRFEPPAELEFEFTPPEPVEIRSANLPLTIGLLISIIAAFIVFIVSIASDSGADDPLLTAFWRMLGALAVLITLSFAASWFMPTPPNRRQLLDQLDAEDRALGHYRAEPSIDAHAMDAELPDDSGGTQDYDSYLGGEFPLGDDDFPTDVGGSLDVTLDDDELFDNIDDFVAGSQDDDAFYDEDEDFLATSPGSSAVAPFEGAEE